MTDVLSAPAGVVATLRTIELFEGLGDEQYVWLANATERRELPDGAVLFHDGAPGTHFYVLAEGELVITKVVDGREEELTRHSTRPRASDQHDDKPSIANPFTGELPLLTDDPYMATATAVGPTTIFAYAKEDFVDMLA